MSVEQDTRNSVLIKSVTLITVSDTFPNARVSYQTGYRDVVHGG